MPEGSAAPPPWSPGLSEVEVAPGVQLCSPYATPRPHPIPARTVSLGRPPEVTLPDAKQQTVRGALGVSSDGRFYNF